MVNAKQLQFEELLKTVIKKHFLSLENTLNPNTPRDSQNKRTLGNKHTDYSYLYKNVLL